MAGAQSRVTHIVIDEIQKAPKLLDVVHRLIESTDKIFILTGSSARKLKRGADNYFLQYRFTYLATKDGAETVFHGP